MESGILYSSYSLMQLVSLLIVGALSDIYGRKLFLILSLFGSCFGSLFQALSKNIVQLIIFRSLTGLFAGSNILVQAVIADLTAPEERNRYYSCLEALNSAGFILGPALGAVLGKKGTHFPLFIAGIFSGIALIFALFLLQETSKDVILLNEMRAKARKASGKEKEVLKQSIQQRQADIKQSRKTVAPKLTKTMVVCFAFEFCNRWLVNAIDSKYGIFLKAKYDVEQDTYSYASSFFVLT
ncbi:uncharacterized protein [Blastocystis hominis]|uniref:Major facilitator superfamily (MFS) profile domain-containing protein n=1 Tax=Blastocystis hominis TaxID=12968 RepID=D8M0V4_BLAHO|nr:uncharacterized protein [Blastocystis hominis]CBK21693.2 unnamed protein product [Blastocystis hominis]|eukprot:XP_012895741.1 uncharacterized protein [Blastocystis hominis]